MLNHSAATHIYHMLGGSSARWSSTATNQGATRWSPSPDFRRAKIKPHVGSRFLRMNAVVPRKTWLAPDVGADCGLVWGYFFPTLSSYTRNRGLILQDCLP